MFAVSTTARVDEATEAGHRSRYQRTTEPSAPRSNRPQEVGRHTAIAERLNFTDVTALLVDCSAESRTRTGSKVAAEFARGQLTASERELAIEILQVLARDVESQVRQVLSEHLKACPWLPRGLAIQLAEDVESVALPIIEFSDVLADEDLIAVIHSGSVAKQIAVAGRQWISAELAAALVDTAKQEVIETLVSNAGAQVTEQSLHKVVDQFGNREAVQLRLIDRKALPLTVVERLATTISGAMRERLIKHHGLPSVLTDELIRHGQESAIVDLASTVDTDDEVERLAFRLYSENRLTSSVILRALYVRNLRLFDASMAALAGITLGSARRLIYANGMEELNTLLSKAHLPRRLLPAFRIGVEAAKEYRAKRLACSKEEYTRAITARLVMAYEAVPPDDLERALFALGRVSVGPEPARSR